jgi:hypothetical protein
MALYTTRKRQTTVHEYVLPNPVNLGEVTKAMSAAYADYTARTGRNVSDDSIYVTHTDEEIILYFEESSKA